MASPLFSQRSKLILIGAFLGILTGFGTLGVIMVRIAASIPALDYPVLFLMSPFFAIALKFQIPPNYIFVCFFGYWLFLGSLLGWVAGIRNRTARLLSLILLAGILILGYAIAQKDFEFGIDTTPWYQVANRT